MGKYEIKQENTHIDYNELKESDFFYDFSHGVEIGDKEISKWIEEIIEKLENAEYGAHYEIASGNTKIYGIKYMYDERYPEEGGYLDINVCKGYEQIEIPLENLIKK